MSGTEVIFEKIANSAVLHCTVEFIEKTGQQTSQSKRFLYSSSIAQVALYSNF